MILLFGVNVNDLLDKSFVMLPIHPNNSFLLGISRDAPAQDSITTAFDRTTISMNKNSKH